MSNIENNHAGTILLVKNSLDRLTASLQRIALHIIKNPSQVIDSTAGQLAKAAHVSEASIVRFCKELGFKGYAEFKIRLAKDLGADNNEPVPENINQNDTPLEIMRKIILTEQNDILFSFEMINKDTLINALNLINKARRIAFFGIGSSYAVAYDAHWHFSLLGKPTQVEQEHGQQIILANSLSSQDLAFAISLSGQSRVPVSALQIAQGKGVPTICLTQNPSSEIVKYSDCQIITFSKQYVKHDLATSSRLSQLALLDALCTAFAATNWHEATEALATNNRFIRDNQF